MFVENGTQFSLIPINKAEKVKEPSIFYTSTHSQVCYTDLWTRMPVPKFMLCFHSH